MGFTSGGYSTQRGLGRAPIQEIRDCSFSFESLRSLLRKPLFPAKWIISELPVNRPIAGKRRRNEARLGGVCAARLPKGIWAAGDYCCSRDARRIDQGRST